METDQQDFAPQENPSSAPVEGGNNENLTKIDKGIQVDMDCAPDEDPKKNKKYWQDLAGLRGAREEYLKFDISELAVENRRLTNCIDYLYAKLEWAEKQISDLEAKKCRCPSEEDYYSKPVGSMCL
ncbi:uncharacterized protein [Epargyreus clarus]